MIYMMCLTISCIASSVDGLDVVQTRGLMSNSYEMYEYHFITLMFVVMQMFISKESMWSNVHWSSCDENEDQNEAKEGHACIKEI